MSNIIDFNGVTKLDLDPERVLNKAKGKLESVVLMGWDKDGEMYFASSMADGGDVLWLIEKCKKALLDIREDDFD